MRINNNFIIQNRISKNNAGFDQSQIALKAQNCSDVFIKRQPAFCGITDQTRLFTQRIFDTHNFIKIEPGNIQIAGDLPAEWAKAAKNNKYENLFIAFAEAAQKLREEAISGIVTDDTLKEARNILEKSLKSFKIIKTNEKIELDSLFKENPALSKGEYGYVFKLTVKNKTYALKVFYIPDRNNKHHGSWQEINRAVFYTNRKPYNDINFIRFFFGSPDKGYMLSEFYDVSKEPRPPRQYLPPELAGVRSRDPKESNIIGTYNKIVDFGGMQIVADPLNELSRNICKDVIYSGNSFDKRFKMWEKHYQLAQNETGPDYKKNRILGVAASFIYLVEVSKPKDIKNIYKAYLLIQNELGKDPEIKNKFINFLRNSNLSHIYDIFHSYSYDNPAKLDQGYLHSDVSDRYKLPSL